MFMCDLLLLRLGVELRLWFPVPLLLLSLDLSLLGRLVLGPGFMHRPLLLLRVLPVYFLIGLLLWPLLVRLHLRPCVPLFPLHLVLGFCGSNFVGPALRATSFCFYVFCLFVF